MTWVVFSSVVFSSVVLSSTVTSSYSYSSGTLVYSSVASVTTALVVSLACDLVVVSWTKTVLPDFS